MLLCTPGLESSIGKEWADKPPKWENGFRKDNTKDSNESNDYQKLLRRSAKIPNGNDPLALSLFQGLGSNPGTSAVQHETLF